MSNTSKKAAKSLIFKPFLAVFILASLFITNVETASAEMFYDAPSSDFFYDAPSSQIFYDSPSYYGNSYGGGSGSYYDATPVYSDWYDYGGYDYGCYSCGGYGDYGAYDYYYPTYSQPAYSYAPAGRGSGMGGNGGNAGGGITYNSNENENTNANSNVNTITNTFNPVNNNDARINVVVGAPTQAKQTVQQSAPTPVYTAPQTYYQPTYTPYVPYVPYSAPSNVTVIRDQSLGNPVSGVFLNQIPATGISFGPKMALFATGLILWSVFAAYMISRRNGSISALSEPAASTSAVAAGAVSASSTIADKVAAFKLANMTKKGIN